MGAICWLFVLRVAAVETSALLLGYRLPLRIARVPIVHGEQIPSEGTLFPERFAAMVEPQRSAVLDAVARVEGGDRTTKHVCSEPQAFPAGLELQVDARAGPQWTRAFDQRTAGAEVDKRDRVPWP